MNVLIIGSGGREHALAWKLAQSEQVNHVYVAPGNGGTFSETKTSNIDLSIKDHKAIIDYCKKSNISLVVIGPEDPLANGLADDLTKANIKCFGASKDATQLESSKAYSKAFMTRNNIPTAKFEVFTDPEKAKAHVKAATYAALVVKASGLAAGKGVIVAANKGEACNAIDSFMKDKILGDAAQEVVIEELLEGEEISVLAFSDGTSVAVMPPAQDHKRLLDNDQGPNTGGMGAYCPCPQFSASLMAEIEETVIKATVQGMKKEGVEYKGVLYAGLMLTKDGPKVLEYNCRFGDPECQVLMSQLEGDLLPILLACINGQLPTTPLIFRRNSYSVAVVLVSQGYPGSYPKGKEITGLDKAKSVDKLVVFHAGTARKEDKVVTSGGRVLAIVSTQSTLKAAIEQANQLANTVTFEGAFHRKDIAHKALKRSDKDDEGMTYKGAGVDIEAADDLVGFIKEKTKSTLRPGTVGTVGSFGALFDLKPAGYDGPRLVAGTDGVGTKLIIAQSMNKHDTIGIDLVAMSVNDILCQGSETLFFLDYFGTSKLEPETMKQVIVGITDGCKQAGCALIGGETSEMPGVYKPGDYDLVGFGVGAMLKNKTLPRIQEIKEGDLVIGFQSSGLHSNGYSLVRRIVDKFGYSYNDPAPFDPSVSLGEALLEPTKIYVKHFLNAIEDGCIKALAHITGGGLLDNIPRVLPPGLGVSLDKTCWTVPPVFSWIATCGKVASKEMLRTFNCGIGMIAIIDPHHLGRLRAAIPEICSDKGVCIGKVTPLVSGQPRVIVNNINFELKHWALPPPHQIKKRKVAVLISGSGTNLQSLIDFTQNAYNQSHAEIVLVVSNKPGVKGLERAQAAGIATKVIMHKNFKSREEFDMKVHEELKAVDVELICLAGFMRILSEKFVKLWRGKLLNIHPSLLPAFKGAHAHRDVLAFGAQVTGCTVHFVEPEVDAGGIVLQDSVKVDLNETVETLQEKVKVVEHRLFPKALELVAQGKITIDENGKIVRL